VPPLARLLVLSGLCLVAAGLLVWLVPSWGWLGRLPGDLRIERSNLRIYVPLGTSLVLSAALSALFWLISRLR
jgi:DUF2905 family protein